MTPPHSYCAKCFTSSLFFLNATHSSLLYSRHLCFMVCSASSLLANFLTLLHNCHLLAVGMRWFSTNFTTGGVAATKQCTWIRSKQVPLHWLAAAPLPTPTASCLAPCQALKTTAISMPKRQCHCVFKYSLFTHIVQCTWFPALCDSCAQVQTVTVRRAT